jgi:hypothetical protein
LKFIYSRNYFENEELESLIGLMQAWLTEYDNENLTEVKDYFKNDYEDMYKLVMTPLKTQYQ